MHASTRPALISIALGVLLYVLALIGRSTQALEGARAIGDFLGSAWGYAVVPGLLVLAGLVMWLSATDTWRNIPGLQRLWAKDLRAEALDRGVTAEQLVQWTEWRAWLREITARARRWRKGQLTADESAHVIADTWFGLEGANKDGAPAVSDLAMKPRPDGRCDIDQLDIEKYEKELRRLYRATRPWTVKYPLRWPQAK